MHTIRLYALLFEDQFIAHHYPKKNNADRTIVHITDQRPSVIPGHVSHKYIASDGARMEHFHGHCQQITCSGKVPESKGFSTDIYIPAENWNQQCYCILSKGSSIPIEAKTMNDSVAFSRWVDGFCRQQPGFSVTSFLCLLMTSYRVLSIKLCACACINIALSIYQNTCTCRLVHIIYTPVHLHV